MTLAANTLIQAAPGITAGAAGVPVELVTPNPDKPEPKLSSLN